jgi:hypothetical protein
MQVSKTKRPSLVGAALAMVTALTASTNASANDKSIALILDASGSMRAKLASGERRIDAAKAAVTKLISGLPSTTRLALRAYGHQSVTAKKNCKDTQLLTPFKAVGDNRSEVIAKAGALNARGYTPITLVLELAANDLKAEQAAKSRVVVLVSDGKETCSGDPCAVVKALAAADASLTVHTIGFAVDVAARYQLQCIARVGRGTYWEANSTDKLVKQLTTAVKTTQITLPKEMKVKSTKPGTLALKNPSASRHEVISVKTGKTVGHLSTVTSSVALPPGFYNVRFGSTLWRSIEVEPGKRTTIETAILRLPAASYRGHEILDWETKEVVGKLSSSRGSMNVMPSSYVVKFGTLEIPVTLKAGEIKDVDAGSISFKGLPINSRSIIDAKTGKEVTTVSATGSSATLPPGNYVLVLGDKKVPFAIKSQSAAK